MTPLSLSRGDKGIVFAAALVLRLAVASGVGSTGTRRTAFLAVSTFVGTVLGSLAVVALASLALRVLRSRRSALVVAGLAVVDPSLLLLARDVPGEPLFLLLLLVAGFLLLVAVDRPSSGCGLFAGVGLALAALMRPSALALSPLLAAPLFDRRFPPAIRRVLAGSACFGFVVALAPGTIRNAVRFHDLLPAGDGGGFAFDPGHSRDPAHPREVLGSIAAKSTEWIRPMANPSAWPAYIALSSLAVFGMARSERRGVLVVALTVLVISFGVHVATRGSMRSGAAYWDPILILYGAAGISSLGGRPRAA